jgi:hypothetical protein
VVNFLNLRLLNYDKSPDHVDSGIRIILKRKNTKAAIRPTGKIVPELHRCKV